MFGIFPLQPAYGRDYKSKAALEADWKAGKDFQCVNGRYCSCRDFDDGWMIEFRYDRSRKVHSLRNVRSGG